MKSEILEYMHERLTNATIECPDCGDTFHINQYTCTTCGCEGGCGVIDMREYLDEHNLKINIVRNESIDKAITVKTFLPTFEIIEHG